MANQINVSRLTDLGYKVKSNTATQAEKDEYMLILYQNGSITKEQYDNYRSNQNTEGLIKLALGIGAAILLAHFLSRD